MSEDYMDFSGYPSHAGYEVLEGDIIRRLEEIRKLPQDDRCYELGRLAQEIYDSNGGQYDMTIIQSLIDRNW